MNLSNRKSDGEILKRLSKIVEIGQTKVAVDENGKLVPGVEIEPESIKFSMEIL
jgi:hypothetical protein